VKTEKKIPGVSKKKRKVNRKVTADGEGRLRKGRGERFKQSLKAKKGGIRRKRGEKVG